MGHGTTVAVHLPRADADVDAPSSGTDVPLSRRNETLLLIDDEEPIRRVTRRLLERLGYAVIEAADPDSALALCRTYAGRIDLLLTDLVMPVMSGVALAEQAQALRPGLRVVYMSGYAADVLDAAGMEMPPGPFLQKPFELRGLATILREALDG